MRGLTLFMISNAAAFSVTSIPMLATRIAGRERHQVTLLEEEGPEPKQNDDWYPEIPSVFDAATWADPAAIGPFIGAGLIIVYGAYLITTPEYQAGQAQSQAALQALCEKNGTCLGQPGLPK